MRKFVITQIDTDITNKQLLSILHNIDQKFAIERPVDPLTERPLGFATCNAPSTQALFAAVKLLDERLLGSRPLKVKMDARMETLVTAEAVDEEAAARLKPLVDKQLEIVNREWIAKRVAVDISESQAVGAKRVSTLELPPEKRKPAAPPRALRQRVFADPPSILDLVGKIPRTAEAALGLEIDWPYLRSQGVISDRLVPWLKNKLGEAQAAPVAAVLEKATDAITADEFSRKLEECKTRDAVNLVVRIWQLAYFEQCAVDRHVETLIRVEEAALQKLNELLSRDFLEETRTREHTAPNAELFVELNQEKRLTMELQGKLDRLQTQATALTATNHELQEKLANITDTLAERNSEISKFQKALHKLRQDRSQSPNLVPAFSPSKEGSTDAVVGLLRNRIKFLEAEIEKLRNSQNR